MPRDQRWPEIDRTPSLRPAQSTCVVHDSPAVRQFEHDATTVADGKYAANQPIVRHAGRVGQNKTQQRPSADNRQAFFVERRAAGIITTSAISR